MQKQKTIKEVKERYEVLSHNNAMVTDPKGKERNQAELDSLKWFLDNPNTNLDYAIENSIGVRQRTLRWIKGELV
jgi:hypothetical protein